jgi:hypothetical protein
MDGGCHCRAQVGGRRQALAVNNFPLQVEEYDEARRFTVGVHVVVVAGHRASVAGSRLPRPPSSERGEILYGLEQQGSRDRAGEVTSSRNCYMDVATDNSYSAGKARTLYEAECA